MASFVMKLKWSTLFIEISYIYAQTKDKKVMMAMQAAHIINEDHRLFGKKTKLFSYSLQ